MPELDERSNRLAQALLGSGIGRGARVTYLGRSAPEVIELLLAASKIGAVIVPLNWRLSRRELAGVLEDSKAPMLIADAGYLQTAEALRAEASRPLALRVVGCEHPDAYEPWLGAHDAVDPGGRGDPNDVVVQMYTSGTTGVPKGVLTTHRNLAAAAATSSRWGFNADTISLTPLPLFHIGGIGWVYCGLWHGATTILVSEFDPAQVLDTLERRRVTNPIFVPTMLQMLTAVPGAAERDYSALRSIVYGASPMTTTALRAALRTFGCEMIGLYGLTETTGGVVHLDGADHDADGPRQHLLRSAGRPYEWVELRIVDLVVGEDLPAHSVGEVWLRAPNVMAGLLQPPGRDRRGADRRRLAAHRRWRLPRRRGLPVPDRPGQGHDRERRRERLPDRGRGGARPAPRRRRRRRHRRARRALGRSRQGARDRRATARPPRRRTCSHLPARAWPATSCRARSSSSTISRARPTGKVLKRELRGRYAAPAPGHERLTPRVGPR